MFAGFIVFCPFTRETVRRRMIIAKDGGQAQEKNCPRALRPDNLWPQLLLNSLYRVRLAGLIVYIKNDAVELYIALGHLEFCG